jgi:UDP-glucose 4-epimerase
MIAIRKDFPSGSIPALILLLLNRFRRDYYFNNVVNTLKLLRAMRRAGVKLLVFSSSCSVYGSTTQTPITEDCPFQPISPYGRTKAIVEQILKDYSQAYGLRYASLRYFNAAGAMPDGSLGEDHRRETHLIPIVLRTALGKQKSVVIYGTDYPTQDGTCIRDYVHVLDLGKAHVMAMEALPTRTSAVYNLGMGRGYSVREVIQTAQEVTGRKIPTEPGPPRAGDPAVLVASPRKIKAELGWQPTYLSLTEIIETAWKWHSTHPDGFVSAD